MKKLLLVLAFGTLVLNADVVVGTFDIGGTTETINAAGTNLNCDLPPSLIPAGCPSATGNALVNNATGDMSPFFLEGALIEGINFPLGTTISVPNWLTLTPSILNGSTPSVSLELTFLPLGSFTSADCGLASMPGQTCTPPGSNFDLENTDTGFTAAFDVIGITHNLLDGSIGAFTGTFTSVVDGESFQSALATIISGGSVTETYTASFNLSAVPEPPFYVLLGLGIALCFVVKRYKWQGSKH